MSRCCHTRFTLATKLSSHGLLGFSKLMQLRSRVGLAGLAGADSRQPSPGQPRPPLTIASLTKAAMATHFSDFIKFGASGSDHLAICAGGSLATMRKERLTLAPQADKVRTQKRYQHSVDALHDAGVPMRVLTSKRQDTFLPYEQNTYLFFLSLLTKFKGFMLVTLVTLRLQRDYEAKC